ncbi:MAG: hypothetical protein U1B79_01035 [Candidatus Pacearchaeota archaeon]|nr:hypothetical protein [Nanoarchaeota archaeon]MDZ4226675.1 hypothetical protein [Candidatus Pacearchaeota archaeon]
MTDIVQASRDIQELERKVQEHFKKYGWKLQRLEFPEEGSNIQTTFAFPGDDGGDIEDELWEGYIGQEWYDKLREIGKEYGIRLALPCSIYMK